MADSSIKQWYSQEVYTRRVIGCFVVVYSILGLYSFFIRLLLRADLIHPFEWIKDGLFSFFKLTTFLYMIVFASLIILMVGLCSYTYSTIPKVYTRKIDILLDILRPFNLALITSYAMIGAFGTGLYLGMEDSDLSALVIACEGEIFSQCLNDRHLFIIFHGGFVAALYALDVIVNNYNCVSLPVAQQRRFIKIKFSALHLVKQSFTVVIRRMKLYILFYAVLGASICEWIISILELDSSQILIWSLLVNLFSCHLWWCVLVTGGATYFMLHIVTVTFNILQVQRIVFPIHTAVDEESVRTLSLALSCKDSGLVKLLGFLDLSLLTAQSPQRRQDLYRISHPGSHPIYWNVVVTESLDLLKSLTTSLKMMLDPDYVEFMKKNDNEQMDRNVPSKIYHDSPLNVRKFRNDPKVVVTANLPAISEPIITMTTELRNSVSKKFATVSEAMRKISIVAYFMKKMPYAVTNQIFSGCQLHIWAIESLSNLIVSSITEDKYGVIQRDMIEIIETFINLQKTINRALKTEIGPNRRKLLSPTAISLQVTLKMSLYRIVIKLEGYLSSIGLSTEYYQYLARYKEFEDY